jgi:LmbE family N-acetylglucosaminyl deacetylase
MPIALALSPHLDDAAFSCGGTLARLAEGGWRVVMATVFTASVPSPTGFALACQLDKGLGPEVDYMALRRAEDEAAAAALGVEPVWLPFREAPHRGYGSAPELFGEVHAEEPIRPALDDAVRDLLASLRPDLVLAPQAVGGHVDHVELVRSLRRVGTPAPILWWRDFPYTIRPGVPREPFAEDFASSPACEVTLDDRALARRVEAALAYASQVGFQFGGSDGVAPAFDRVGPVERFRAEGAEAPPVPGLALAKA